MDKLKLIAFDAEDLAVVSVHLQDAVLKVADMAYQPRAKRFVAVLNRFDWSGALKAAKTRPERRQTALRLERVLDAKHSGIDLRRKGDVLSLLAMQFEAKAADDPAGVITLIFAGGAAIRLEVECIEVELKDLGPAWRARSKPQHPED